MCEQIKHTGGLAGWEVGYPNITMGCKQDVHWNKCVEVNEVNCVYTHVQVVKMADTESMSQSHPNGTMPIS